MIQKELPIIFRHVKRKWLADRSSARGTEKLDCGEVNVLGILKAGTLAERFVVPFFLTAPFAENFRGAREALFLFFMSARINSRAAPPADAVILRSPLGRRFYFRCGPCFARFGVLSA
jgi:hypothetical protein